MSVGLLASFWYFQRFDFERLGGSVPLILDSGAFSAFTSGGHVELAEYGRWVKQWQERVDFAFNLDVLGDPAGSFDNWLTLRDQCGVETVPVIHFGARAGDVLPAYLDAGASRVACGGMVGSAGGGQTAAWAAHVFRWLRENGYETPLHGLGVHMSNKNLARLPWTTTDSSSFTSAWRFARLILFDPYTKRWETVALNGRDIYRHARAVKFYGFTPRQVAVSTKETRHDLIRLTARIERHASEAHDANRYMVDAATEHFLMLGRSIDHVDKPVTRDRYLVHMVSDLPACHDELEAQQ